MDDWNIGLGDQPADLVKAFDVDFVLNVGGANMDYTQVSDVGGVPYGSEEAAGYQSLSDFLRDGGSGEAYVSSANSSSLSDILRSGTPSLGFDSAVYDSSGAVPGSSNVITEWNVASVIDSFTKGITALGGVAIGAATLARSGGSTGTSGSGSRSATGAGTPTLTQRLFGGLSSGPSGNPPQTLMWGALVAVVAVAIFALVARRG
jgi:hypothetical protein